MKRDCAEVSRRRFNSLSRAPRMMNAKSNPHHRRRDIQTVEEPEAFLEKNPKVVDDRPQTQRLDEVERDGRHAGFSHEQGREASVSVKVSCRA